MEEPGRTLYPPIRILTGQLVRSSWRGRIDGAGQHHDGVGNFRWKRVVAVPNLEGTRQHPGARIHRQKPDAGDTDRLQPWPP